MGNIDWLQLMSALNIPGKSHREREEDCLSSKLNVDDEYQEAFRTKSYIEMWSKVEGQLGKTANTRRLSLSSTQSSSMPFIMNLTEYLLEPRQETVKDMTERFDVHHLLLEYFANSLEACRYCDIILEGIHETRVCYQKIKRVVKLSKALDEHHKTHPIKDQFKSLYGELAAFASHKNPLSVVTPTTFRDIHDSFDDLLHRLTSERRKINRRRKFKTFWKKIAGMGLVLSHSALLIVLLIFSLHSLVGIIAAPGILCCLVGLIKKKKKVRGMEKGLSEKLDEQLDVAAKGMYILINDFDTMNRMVKRLHDEVEHQRTVAHMCLNNRKSEILMEVVREIRAHEPSFLDQLEELEEHIYLCFLTVNRSRRLVIEAIMEK